MGFLSILGMKMIILLFLENYDNVPTLKMAVLIFVFPRTLENNYLIFLYKQKFGTLCEYCESRFFCVSRYMCAASAAANP